MTFRLPHILLSLGLAVIGLPAPAAALDLHMPAAARLVLDQTEAMDRYQMPTGPWSPTGGMISQDKEGQINRYVWQVVPFGGTCAQLLAPLRAQLVTDGYEVLYSCSDQNCGGFDFRFGMDVAPEPDMHVDLDDFIYLAARKETGDATYDVALLVSRGGGNGYIHMIQISPPGEPVPEVTQSTRAPADEGTVPPPVSATAGIADNATLISALETTGRATLEGLHFQTGASALPEQENTSLTVLADYLIRHPARRVVLVGHTDAEGSLQNNIALSRARAAAVRSYLVSALNVPATQIRAEGIGYLSPRAPNDTNEGRERNRRVEVVLTNTE
ncbi:OmpA family protein [Rhodophyticola sp. CCM32]|uniref:OmpA family protein n=1 Tax=Rhodophyticola sp. CCM32 TaxID=2916397 RepID=UPI00107F210D|nr:OmpA family protein [Rhodophyticola sp. CCM32]QBY01976.1 OmpA family protein [Rhodophyticola sp. CCM32]